MADAEAEMVPDAYRRHVASIRGALPDGMRGLVDSLNVHDARVRWVALDADARQVRVQLRCGDRAGGYEDVLVTYVDAELEPAALAAFRDATDDVHTEVLYDEIDVADRHRFSHRLLFWPYREVELTFSDAILERTPVGDRDFTAVEPRWIEI